MMSYKIIDSHIHLDQYNINDINNILNYPNLEGLLSVSTDLQSCQKNLQLQKMNPKVHTAFGFHPEQELPTEVELNQLFTWMDHHKKNMTAVGEVGLPYYLRMRKNPYSISLTAYLELLESFIKWAKKWDKPIVLHAIYEDAPLVINLLEKHSINRAHFHWFKGDSKTLEWMAKNKYFISITPDVVYEIEIQQLVQNYPIQLLMVETDGPWQFDGPFQNTVTQPRMIHSTIDKISSIIGYSNSDVYQVLLHNTKKFYFI